MCVNAGWKLFRLQVFSIFDTLEINCVFDLNLSFCSTSAHK